jgi:tRNA pseudouridine55 synthase
MNATDRLFVGFKPTGPSSNSYLGRLKKKYHTKDAGYSGTLDPFANGALIVAFGKYTKLFRFLKKTPKSYRATLWLGAHSVTLDIERIDKIDALEAFDENIVKDAIENLTKITSIIPPKFSAKKIEGKKAYELARKGAEFELKSTEISVRSSHLVSYRHPFVTFEVCVSEGTYIRSLGEILAGSLGAHGSLTYLERLNEGEFVYANEKPLDPLKYLDLKENFSAKSEADILMGKKMALEELKLQDDGFYTLVFERFFSIIHVLDGVVTYAINDIKKFKDEDC